MGLKAEEFEGFLEFSKPFLEQAKFVFKTMAECDISASKPYIKNRNESFDGVTAVMNISGTRKTTSGEVPFEGILVLLFPLETYFKVASQMMMDEYDTMHPHIEDLGASIANMITGNVKQELKSQSLHIGMALPSTIQPEEDMVVKYPTESIIVAIPIHSKYGDFTLELSYSNALSEQERAETESIKIDKVDEAAIDYDGLLKDSEQKIESTQKEEEEEEEEEKPLETQGEDDLQVDLGLDIGSGDDLGDDDFEDDDEEFDFDDEDLG